MKELSGKAAFVTGAASGIGLGIARSLAKREVAVAVADIDFEEAQRVSSLIEGEGGRAVAVRCDVTSADQLESAREAAVQALGPIQLLVNNVGAFTVSRFEDTSEQDWEWLIDINVLGVVRGLHAFLPHMREHGGACHIVNTASVSGHIATGSLSIYTATKFAVVGLSESLRLELADSPIEVSVLCPGIVRTGLLESSARHRSERHGGSDATRAGWMKDVIATGSNPDELGEQVVEGIVRGDFYLLTHPNLRPAFEARFNEILEAY